MCDEWQCAQHELCGQVVRCPGWLAPEPCLRAQVEVGGSRAAQVEETEARLCLRGPGLHGQDPGVH